MRTNCRHRRVILAAGALLGLAGGAHAQQGAGADAADQNLDVTMKLLPEGATRPDAVTRVIQLPEARRQARQGLDAERRSFDEARDNEQRLRRDAVVRDGGPGVAGGFPNTGDRAEIAGDAASDARMRQRDAAVGRAAPELSVPRDAAADLPAATAEAAADARDAAADARDAGGVSAAEARDAAASVRDAAAADARDAATDARGAAAGARDAATDARDAAVDARDVATGARDGATDVRDAVAGARDAAAEAREGGFEAAGEARDAVADAIDAAADAAAEARQRGRDIAEDARRDRPGRPD